MVTLASTACGGSPSATTDDDLPPSQPLEVACVNGASFGMVVRAPDDPQVIWGLSVGRALVSRDGGASWDSPVTGAEALTRASTVIPGEGGRALIVGVNDFEVSPDPRDAFVALRTDDAGRTTTAAARVEPTPMLHGRAADWAFEADGMQVAALDNVVYTSRDGGASWGFAQVPGVGLWPETNGDGSGRFLVDAEGYTVASWDFGATRTRFSTPDEELQVRAIGPTGHLMVAGMPHIEGRGGIFASRDSGATWTRVWRGGAPRGAWVDPKDDAVWIPLASKQDAIGKVLELRLLVLHDWGDRSELFSVSAGGVPLLGMEGFRRNGDIIEFVGVFAPTENVRERLACRLGPGVASRLDPVRAALPAAAPQTGEVALVARRFEQTVERTSMAFDGSGNPWVLHDDRLMSAAPPTEPWWVQPGRFPFDAWPDGGGFVGLVFDARGRLLLGQGPRQYSLGAVRLYSLDPNTQRVVDSFEWDDVRVRNEAGFEVVPVPRRLLWSLGQVWIGSGDATAPLGPPGPRDPTAIPDYRNARLPGGGTFSPSGRWFAWTPIDPEAARAPTVTHSAVGVGPVLAGHFPGAACSTFGEPVETTECVDYPGEAWVVGVTSDRLVIVLDRVRGIVVARRFEDPAAPWVRVAEGFIHPTDLAVREVAGTDVVFVHDGDVFAFTPDLAKVARRSLTSDMAARVGVTPVPFAVPVVPTAEDPYGCVADHPCIRPDEDPLSVEALRIVSWGAGSRDVTLRGEGLGSAGTLFVDGEPYPTDLWTESRIYLTVEDPDHADGELWVVVDGVESNHLQHVSRPVIERVEPEVAEPGDIVSLIGRNFGAAQGAHLIHPRMDAAGHGLVVGWSDTRVDFIVEAAQSGVLHPNVYKLGVYPAEREVTLEVVPVITSGCRSARHEPCQLTGASLGSVTSVTVDGHVATLVGKHSMITFDWPDAVAPGPHEVVLATDGGVERRVEATLDPWAHRRLGPMNHQGHNLGAHPGWLARTADGLAVVTVGFTIGAPTGVPIPGPPYLQLMSLTPSATGLEHGFTQLPKYRLSADYEDLPWLAVHDGVTWTAGNVQTAAVSIGADGQDVLSDVRVPDPREARLVHALGDGTLAEEDILATAPDETGRPVGLASLAGALWLAVHRDDEATTRLLRRGDAGWSRAATVDTHGGFVATDQALYVGACGERTPLLRVTATPEVTATTLPPSGLDLLERCAAAPAALGGGLLAVGVDAGGARAVVHYGEGDGWVPLASVPPTLPGYAPTTTYEVEDVGDVDGAPALLVAVREGPERGLRLFVWDAAASTWRARGGEIANLSDAGWDCPGPWGNLNECSGDMGNLGCAFFACPVYHHGWRPRAGHVGRARFAHAGGLTTVVYEQWFDDGVPPGEVLGDNALMVATLTSP